MFHTYRRSLYPRDLFRGSVDLSSEYWELELDESYRQVCYRLGLSEIWILGVQYLILVALMNPCFCENKSYTSCTLTFSITCQDRMGEI